MIYGSEIWVVTVAILKVIEVFHHQVARRITGVMMQCKTGRDWEWSLVDKSLDTARIFPIK